MVALTNETPRIPALPRALATDAANRLDELERENAALRKALQRIRSELEMHINWRPTGVAVEVAIAFEIAREALEAARETGAQMMHPDCLLRPPLAVNLD
jgi:hypothetical protein